MVLFSVTVYRITIIFLYDSPSFLVLYNCVFVLTFPYMALQSISKQYYKQSATSLGGSTPAFKYVITTISLSYHWVKLPAVPDRLADMVVIAQRGTLILPCTGI